MFGDSQKTANEIYQNSEIQVKRCKEEAKKTRKRNENTSDEHFGIFGGCSLSEMFFFILLCYHQFRLQAADSGSTVWLVALCNSYFQYAAAAVAAAAAAAAEVLFRLFIGLKTCRMKRYREPVNILNVVYLSL